MTSRASLGLLLATIATGSTLVAAAPASAVGPRTLYTNPHGSGSQCTKTDPCFLDEAFGDALTGDTILIGAGSYGSKSNPVAGQVQLEQTGVIVRDLTSSVPVLYSDAGSGVGLTADSTLTGLVLDYTGPKAGLSVAKFATATRVAVVGDTNGLSCVVAGTLNDSLCTNIAAGAIGAAGYGGLNVNLTPTFHGDTIEATGSGENGLAYNLGSSSTVVVSVTNTIVHGVASDIQAATSDPTASVSVQTNHSDYVSSSVSSTNGEATITSGPGDISEPPIFAAGSYLEKTGSPTINAGAKDPASETDLDGLSRAIGGAPDIGAYERTVAPLLTKATITPAKKSARIKLSVNPEGLAGTVLFKATILNPPKGSKGKKTLTTKPQALAALAKNIPVSISLSGLTPKTKYSIVVVAKNSVGRTTSPPIKITTK